LWIYYTGFCARVKKIIKTKEFSKRSILNSSVHFTQLVDVEELLVIPELLSVMF
jgi:hypothetical protein